VTRWTSIEICAGAGGTAIGVERAGFRHVALLDNDPAACATLRLNRPQWNVIEGSIFDFSAKDYPSVDLFSAGVPCPPFSRAGMQLGEADERDLFPQALRLITECEPRAVMFENVRGILDSVFDDYRKSLERRLRALGFTPQWKLLQASDFGVAQLRPRAVCVALRTDDASHFAWPIPLDAPKPTVGQVLLAEMRSGGWKRAEWWARRANRIAPTIVGGSKKHGGPDLGPTRAKREWATLGVNALKLGDRPPTPGFRGRPHLTVGMAAIIQGFPPEWRIDGRKTAAYRQIGNAFPPPVSEAVAFAVRRAMEATDAQGTNEHSNEYPMQAAAAGD
jgi:DNA (cytosine-5)-methyltransferase 1